MAKPDTPSDYERVVRYVERRFAASRWTAYPTVREVARAIGLTFVEVETVASSGDGNLQLTSYYTEPPEPLGDHFVETLNAPECSWCGDAGVGGDRARYRETFWNRRGEAFCSKWHRKASNAAVAALRASTA